MFDWIGSLFSKLFNWLLSLLPDWLGDGYQQIAEVIGPAGSYFVYLFALDVVAPTILTAYGIRFLIRRLPVVG